MNFIYAQLDEENICIGISYLSGPVTADNVVRIDEETASICMGWRYDDGNWIKMPKADIPEQGLSENYQTMLETAINVEYLVCMADMGF